METILKNIGKDSGFGDNNNSWYIEENNNLTIIDAGFTVFNEIKHRFDLSTFNNINIVITHLHTDHSGSLPQIVLYAYYIHKKIINIISKCEHIETFLKITGVTKDMYTLSEKLETKDIKHFEFIKTNHCKELDTYGFTAEINSKKIIYTSDTNTIEPFLKELENAEELYIDLSRYGGEVHLKFDDILPKLIEISKKGTKIIPMHLDDAKYIEEKIASHT